MNKVLLVVCSFVWALSALAQNKTTPASIHLKTRDLTPKFLSFYDAAVKQNASGDLRWGLWKDLYGFAAVPPTPQGDSVARTLLDAAWARYPSIMDLLKKGAGAISPVAEKQLTEVAALLKPDSAFDITLLVYVGGFEDNAFAAANNGKVTVAVAIETSPSALPLILTHELTHAVQIGMGSFSGGWQRSIGATIVTEGLAMRVAQKLFPGRPDKDFTDHTPGWLAGIAKHRNEILKNIEPFLSSHGSNDVMRFTMGKGASGFEREAYYVGWLVVGHWLAKGMDFSDIARIPEKDMPLHVQKTIVEMLGDPVN